jgi:hypothetical protein
MKLRAGIISLFLVTAGSVAYGTNETQEPNKTYGDGAEYRVGGQVSVSAGDREPLWLNANRYGLSSLKRANGYVRAGIFRDITNDTLSKWRYGYGADVAVAAGFTSSVVVQQAYAEGQWQFIRLTAGSKEYPLELKNQELSTGSQALGVNARPVPQLRLSMPDYVAIPYTRGWLAFKCHGAYGMMTDDGWQRDFTQCRKAYTEGVLYHSKAGYVRIGPGRINFELGLEMGCLFGGKAHLFNGTNERVIENETGFSAYLHALTAGGSDVTDGDYKNSEGNHVGNWTARLNIDRDSWWLGLYVDQMFEDNSMMVHIAYNGWGEGETAFQHTRSRYFVYDFKDGLLGAELQLKKCRLLNDIVVEFLTSKYQGGPVYHDITTNIGEHITGRDNYYNHHLFNCWQHWGQVMGNPLYRSPLYNDDGEITVYNNRFTAWHAGISGNPSERWHYRLLATWQRGYGTYNRLLLDKPVNVSLLAEATYGFAGQSPLGGWQVKAAFGLDRGGIYGKNAGLQLSVVKAGRLKWGNHENKRK